MRRRLQLTNPRKGDMCKLGGFIRRNAMAKLPQRLDQDERALEGGNFAFSYETYGNVRRAKLLRKCVGLDQF